MMVFYIGMLGICALFGAYSIFRLTTDRFPSVGDLATISVLYYSVPLSVAAFFYLNHAGMVFLNRLSSDKALAFTSLTYTVTALVALSIGRLVGARRGAPGSLLFVKLNWRADTRVTVIMAASIGLVGLGIFLFGVGTFMSGYAEESDQATGSVGIALVYFAVAGLGFCLMISGLLGPYVKNPTRTVLVLATMAVFAFVFVVRAKRLEILAAFIPIAIVYLSSLRPAQAFRLKIALGFLALVLSVGIAFVRVSWDADASNITFSILAEGLYAGHTLPGIIDRLNSGLLEYEYGARYLNSLLAFVPSFLWSAKDEMLYAGNAYLEKLAPLGATSLLAEVILQGGYVAVVLTFGLMGYVFERLMKFTLVWDDARSGASIPFRFGLYIVAIAVFVPHFRDGIIPSFKLALQASVLYVILVSADMFRRHLQTPDGGRRGLGGVGINKQSRPSTLTS